MKNEWQHMASAPKDGSIIEVILKRGGSIMPAQWSTDANVGIKRDVPLDWWTTTKYSHAGPNHLIDTPLYWRKYEHSNRNEGRPKDHKPGFNEERIAPPANFTSSVAITREYEVWMEGYVITGNSGTAHLVGKTTASSFDEACIKVCGDRLDKVSDTYRRGSAMYPTVPGTERTTEKGNYTVWGCQLYDNEADARKAFG